MSAQESTPLAALTPELRFALHGEVHARPPQELQAPQAISNWVLCIRPEQRAASRRHLNELLTSLGHEPVNDDGVFARVDLGSLRLCWELHTEFVVWTLYRPLIGVDLADRGPLPTAAEGLSVSWREGLPGRLLTRIDLWLLQPPAAQARPLLDRVFGPGARLVGSRVIGGSAAVHTDFHLRGRGSLHFLVLIDPEQAIPPTPRQLGRLVQRLREIECYRMAALLGLPEARRVVHWLAGGEARLAEIAQAVRVASDDDEPALLDRLTRLAAELESLYASTHTRFSASAAYHGLVRQRLQELKEQRLDGLQPLHEFMQRRLSPAMATCASADRRQAALSARIARIGDLLRTHVEVRQQMSSRELLAAMNRRQGLQLKLQSTVEGLSVAAITYYAVGLVAYLARGAQEMGWPISVDLTTALAVPLVALGVWRALRRMHRHISRSGG